MITANRTVAVWCECFIMLPIFWSDQHKYRFLACRRILVISWCVPWDQKSVENRCSSACAFVVFWVSKVFPKMPIFHLCSWRACLPCAESQHGGSFQHHEHNPLSSGCFHRFSWGVGVHCTGTPLRGLVSSLPRVPPLVGFPRCHCDMLHAGVFGHTPPGVRSSFWVCGLIFPHFWKILSSSL